MLWKTREGVLEHNTTSTCESVIEDPTTEALVYHIDHGVSADVSHEIKNPLTSLRSAVETILIIKDEKQKKKLMSIALDDINRLDRLITDISSASRLDADLLKDEMTTLNLTKLINGFIKIRKDQ